MKKLLLCTLALFSTPAFAMNAHQHHAMEKPAASAVKKTGDECNCTPSTKAYKKANASMHKGMMVPYTGDVDTDFVRGMIPHHQGAVDMVNVVLEYGHNPEIREMATWMKSVQEQEIAQMKHWLATRGTEHVKPNAKGLKSSKAYEAAMHKMHAAMNIKFTGDADVDFARGMIAHHQGAIDMAEVVLASGQDPVVIDLARGVVESQRAEIAKMQAWLAAKGK